jgi:glutamyl-tRNA synthetase
LRTPDLLQKFSLDGVSRTNGVFDRNKLEWFNTQYLQKLPIEDVLPRVQAELQRHNLWKEEWAAGAGHEWFKKTVDLLRSRVRLLPDFATWSRAFFTDDFPRDPAAIGKFWKDEKTRPLLEKLADALAALTEWNHDACDHATRKVAEEGGVKAGMLINATRVAIVGQAVAPPLFDTMIIIGQKKVVTRLRDSLHLL